jgi:hypothetical protein
MAVPARSSAGAGVRNCSFQPFTTKACSIAFYDRPTVCVRSKARRPRHDPRQHHRRIENNAPHRLKVFNTILWHPPEIWSNTRRAALAGISEKKASRDSDRLAAAGLIRKRTSHGGNSVFCSLRINFDLQPRRSTGDFLCDHESRSDVVAPREFLS